MGKVQLQELVSYCEDLLDTGNFEDWPGALNGLQVENGGEVSRIAAAVDASLATVRMAIGAKADLLLVHHGLFWGRTRPWVGAKYDLMQLLVRNDLAVYSSHLPLDAHGELGNNVQLCRALGFQELEPFFFDKGRFLGQRTEIRVDREELKTQLRQVLGDEPKLIPGGPEACRKIGVVTGGAGGELALAAKEGVDTFITGEGPHWTYALAEELGLNVFYGGHYATETFGVRALAGRLSDHYGVPWIFLDHPSGL